MRPTLTTTIPVRNGEAFIAQTLESLVSQTRTADRVIVLDNCSTDGTPGIVKEFQGRLPIEYVRNPMDLGLFGNMNRALDFAAETDYLHLLHADDLVRPQFYEKMIEVLADCPGRGMAWCLDERIDDTGSRLSVSGRADGTVEILDKDTFLAQKAEIGNQAFCATLLKTHREPIPERFPLDMPILGDMVYWARFGSHCRKLAKVNLPLGQYRWHGANQTVFHAPTIDVLIVDEWRTMQLVEALRGKPPGMVRRAKLKGLMAVRSGIKAMRVRQLGDKKYSREIVRTARGYTGWPLWMAGQCVVYLREWLVFKLGRRPRHPQNIFS